MGTKKVPLSFKVRKLEIPASSRIRKLYSHPDLHDAYEVDLPSRATDDPELMARHLQANPAPWFGMLMRVRDFIVAPLGIKTSRQFEFDAIAASQDRISFFLIFERRKNELVYGQNDVHLDFRSSILVLPADPTQAQRRLAAITVVKCHNLLGKMYMALIAPFHRLVVIGGLRQAAKAGWPEA